MSGQITIPGEIQIFLKASLRRGEAFEHTLFFGDETSETALSAAREIASYLGANIRIIDAKSLQTTSDLEKILTELEDGDVLFVDDIRSLKPQLEEILYSAMENFQLDLTIGQGTAARSIKIELPKFTVIGSVRNIKKIPFTIKHYFGIINDLKSWKQII